MLFIGHAGRVTLPVNLFLSFQFHDLRLLPGHNLIGLRVLELLYLVAKRINGLSLEEIVFAPFGIVKGVAIQQHDEPFHFHASNLFGQDGESLAFKFAICHRHVNHLQRTQLGTTAPPCL